MRQSIPLLMVTLVISVLLFSPKSMADMMQTTPPPSSPQAPQCGWYESWNQHEEWWEYWCYYPGYGWEYVFWSY